MSRRHQPPWQHFGWACVDWLSVESLVEGLVNHLYRWGTDGGESLRRYLPEERVPVSFAAAWHSLIYLKGGWRENDAGRSDCFRSLSYRSICGWHAAASASAFWAILQNGDHREVQTRWTVVTLKPGIQSRRENATASRSVP